MGAQRRGGRDAENVVETVGPTPVENLGAAIMAVGAQHDFRHRPVGADRAQEAPQKGAGLRALWPFGGTQHGGEKAAPAVEYDNRLEAIFIVMRVEQPQLLAAVNSIERVVDVQHDTFGNLLE